MTRKHDAMLCSSASETPASGEQPASRGRPGCAASKKKEAGTTGSSNNRVLCPTCMHVDGCVLFSSGERPAWHCEEFASTGAPDRATAGPSTGATPMSAAAAQQKHLGLCVNCEDRETCTFPRPEGGVWRCNEYR
ncbi:MAG: hypothetical protein JRG91_14745 [Deltaproteobacteria bacterium]|nr:hypothetical protein [Deltaproteobacteria bacterium]